MSMTRANWQLPIGLLLAGALHALTFAPDPLPQWAMSPLQLVTMAWLVRQVWQAPTGLKAAGRAWLFGLGHFSVGLYWLTISMHTYGYMPMPLAIAALLAFSAYLALFYGLAGWITSRTGQVAWVDGTGSAAGPIRAALVWASAWTLAEWLRATLFTGFAWLNTGYAHTDSWFAAWSAVLGVYGVTFMVAFAAAALAGLVGTTHFSLRHQPQRAMAGVIAIVLALAGWGLQFVNWTTPLGNPIAARLVQGAVDQGAKFAPGELIAGIRNHLALAARPPSPGMPAPQIVLLPETAIPVFSHQLDPAGWEAWRNLAGQQQSTILTGVPLFDRTTGHITNSVIALDGDTPVASLVAGTPTQRYDKHHLVPFGEFVPWGFRWFVDLMAIPLGDFNRGGTAQPPFKIKDQFIAPNICYEDIFGEELLPSLHTAGQESGSASMLANFSNLGWFGDSWALRQHWQMARMRAIETSRPVLRATNTGITGAINPHGVPIGMLAPLRPGILDVWVQGQTGLTPYARLGNWPVLLIALAVLFWTRLRRRQRT